MFLNLFRNLKTDWSLVPGSFFDNFVYWKRLRSKEKIKLPFLRHFDNLLSKYLTLKEFLAYNSCFGLFTRIIKGSGTSFCYVFSAWFFQKNVLYLILHLWKKFQCHKLFSSQDIKQNVLEFLFRQLMVS